MADRTNRLGQLLGEYRLVCWLGGGGFGDVYLGEQVRDHSQAAVKVLQVRLSNGEELKEFINEARTFRLNHPNIVRLLDFGLGADDIPFLVMEYAPNGTLRSHHPKGSQLPLSTIVSYVVPLASALQYAHDLHIVHRDVKPENMLLGPHHEVLLSDFGIAAVAHSSRSLNTQEGVGGTLPYMAPEQFHGKPRPASDQYALGISVYEWLCGKRPFNGTAVEIAMQHMMAPPSPLREHVPTLSPEVEQVILTALAKDPKERFINIQAFATALTHASRSPQSSLSASFVVSHSPTPLPSPLADPISNLAPPLLAPDTVITSNTFSPNHDSTILANPPLPLPPTEKASSTPPFSSEVKAAQSITNAISTEDVSSAAPPSSSFVDNNLQTSARFLPQGASIAPPSKGPSVIRVLATATLLAMLIGGGLYMYVGLNRNTANTSGINGSQSNTNGVATAMKVALVTDIGGLNDHGFNQLAYAGYTRAEQQYHFKEQVIQTQSVNDFVNNLTRAAQNADLIIATGFSIDTPLDQVAKEFPSKKFADIDGCPIPNDYSPCETLPNVAPILFREQEASCLVGAIAAQMELDGKAKVPKLHGSNTIGAIGGFSIAFVKRYIASYKFCAQKVDPTINVVINYSQDFIDTTKCHDLALNQITQHQADIILQVASGCGTGTLGAADQQGVFGIGFDTDESYLYPSVITSAVKRVDTAVFDTITSCQHKQFTNKPPIFDLANNGVDYAKVSADVPADAQATAENFRQQIIKGTLTLPTNIL
jgi:basic membrane protein A